jgi:hypothetical protein
MSAVAASAAVAEAAKIDLRTSVMNRYSDGLQLTDPTRFLEDVNARRTAARPVPPQEPGAGNLLHCR